MSAIRSPKYLCARGSLETPHRRPIQRSGAPRIPDFAGPSHSPTTLVATAPYVLKAAMRSPAPLPDFNGMQEVIEYEVEAAQFLDPYATPIANFRSKLEIETEPPVTFHEDEFIPAGLTDVAREPVGPRRLPTICSAQASVLANSAYKVWLNNVTCTICGEDFADAHSGTNPPMLVNCPSNHVFHYDCLKYLINGIASYSNRCPNCRTVICPERAESPGTIAA